VKTDSAASTFRWDGNRQTTGYAVVEDARKEKILKRVMEAVTPGKFAPLSQRFNGPTIDSVLSQGLQQNGIAIPFHSVVMDISEGSGPGGPASLISPNSPQEDFSVPLFPGDFTSRPARLKVTFPTYEAFLFSEFLPELISILALVGSIVFCFWYTVRTILRQKEFAGRLTDFINTMTHEFKTPISTIALANEAIIRPDVVRSNTKLRRYNKVIGDENRRMRNQVEKILQMATLEEGEHDFNMVRLDMHEIIRKAVDILGFKLRRGRET
jgi:two-component system phosphate regulon sensor histidine kinase PhoR